MTAALQRAEELRRFRSAYAEQRATEGRGQGGAAELLALPYIETGAQARAWQVRARTFNAFLRHVVTPAARAAGTQPLRVLDLGAGNGWLCYRMRQLGHAAVALDVRTDDVDGLGAGSGYATHVEHLFPRTAASFDALPLAGSTFDVVVFNAALHYALDLRTVLAEAARVLIPGGSIAILDSPFYTDEQSGMAMVADKRRTAAQQFGARAGDLLGLPFIEFLTRARLVAAAQPLGLTWRRYRVRYPLWYEARSWLARLRGRRTPSRFDLWQGMAHDE